MIVDLGWERLEPGDQEVDRYGIGLGYYLTDSTTAIVDYRKTNVNKGGDVDSWRFGLEHFFAFNYGGLKARAAGGKTVVGGLDDPTVWTLGGTWYLGNNWGFSADYEKSDFNGFETDGYSIGAQWFITDNFAVDLAYSDLQPDDIDLPLGGKREVEYDEIAISALYRF